MDQIQIGFAAIVGLLAFIAIWIIFYFIPVGLWFSALVSGVKINLLQLFLMRWRRVPSFTMPHLRITAPEAGFSVSCWASMRLRPTFVKPY